MQATNNYDIYNNNKTTTDLNSDLTKLFKISKNICEVTNGFMSELGKTMSSILFDTSFPGQGQGEVYRSISKYFKKDRESRNIYCRYPVNNNYNKYIRKTTKATKQPVRRSGWRNRR